jgi:dTDP-4-dehydrorhamnose reductase
VDTKPDSVDEYYRLNLYQVAMNIAHEATSRGVVLVHLSHAMDYAVKGDFERCTEEDALAPATAVGKYRVQADKDMQALPGLKMVLIRSGLLYGAAEQGSSTRGLLYAYLGMRAGIPMPSAFDPKISNNTLHTVDAARAMLHLAEWYTNNKRSGVEVFNVSDPGYTSKFISHNLYV